jgi:plasmid maintenance system antidote protein VapI
MTVAIAATKDLSYAPLTEDHINNPSYSPATLLDAMLGRYELKNDAALARALQLPPPVISKLRSKQVGITPAILLRMHEVTGWAVSDLKARMGLKSQFVTL